MARTLWLYNLYRALCTAHLHRPFFVFVFLARGLSMAQVMLLQMIFSAAVIALEVPTGAWADRLGRRRSMGLGALLMAAASLGYLVAPGFWSIAACEFAFAAGLTLTSGADSAYLYDALAAAGRSDDYLRQESVASAYKHVGLGVAAAAGGLLAHFVGLGATFVVTAVASLAAFALTLGFPERRAVTQRLPAAAGAPMGYGLAVETIRRHPAIWFAILYSSLIFVLIRVSDTLFQPVLRAQGFEMLGLGLVFAGLNFVAAAAALRVGRSAWARWEEPILWAMPITLAVCYLFIGLLGPVMVVLLMVAHFAVTGIYSPVVKTLINRDLTESGVRATVLSAESAVKRLVVLVVTPVLSLIFALGDGARPGAHPTTPGMRPALLLCGGIAVLGVVLRAVSHWRRGRAPAVSGAAGPVAAPAAPSAFAFPSTTPKPLI
jgi:MFS family permease